EALVYLKGRERYGIKFGLSNIDRLAEALGRPERRYRSLLVAGTNGKGSTVALSESILRASGLRTGRYTSPHLRTVTERIGIEGQPISHEHLASVLSQVRQAAETLFEGESQGSAPTYFEALTAAAFLAFAERDIDTAVFEVGMGGRFDATNIVPASVAVICPIGFDHERFLGSTLAAIASEKAAIIKPGRPVVVGRLPPEALEVVREEALAKGATLVAALEEVSVRREREKVRLLTPTRDYGLLDLPLAGDHQLENLALAVRAVECFSGGLSVEDVARGVAATEWPGRLQRIPGEPSILLDAAHNVMAVESLVRYLETCPQRKRVLLFGVMKDKRVWEMLSKLLPHVSAFVATRPEMSRARDPERLARFAKERGVPAEAVRSPAAALARARELAGREGEVLVAGSIFLLGEVMAEL
ncbi:MAG TPA: folylpolyglutamate synthase/dihydrofolate synthase family protein, partial [Vicinamibacteria bacterium]